MGKQTVLLWEQAMEGEGAQPRWGGRLIRGQGGSKLRLVKTSWGNIRSWENCTHGGGRRDEGWDPRPMGLRAEQHFFPSH